MSLKFNLKVVENYERILSREMVWLDGFGDNLDMESEGKGRGFVVIFKFWFGRLRVWWYYLLR